MTLVIVRDALDVAQAMGAAPPLIIHADDQRVVRRAQVQANTSRSFSMKNGSLQLEAIGAMRLQPEELEVALPTGLRDAGLGGHAAHAPVRRAIG